MRKFFNYSDPEESKRRKQNIILFALIMMLLWGVVTCLAAWQVTSILGVQLFSQGKETTPIEIDENEDSKNNQYPESKIEAGEKISIMLPGKVPLVLVRIPAGTFMMGRCPEEVGSNTDEEPKHEVTIAQDFYIGKYEVTQQQWLALMGFWPDTSPITGQVAENNCPAYYVSWDDTQEFIFSLNNHIRNTNQGTLTVRLPSEAEWEYACRAGTATRFYWGDDPEYLRIDDYAWYIGNSGGRIQPVGEKLPNTFGLYDMTGNVWEYCEDAYHSNYVSAPVDGSAWTENPLGTHRLDRGGAWNSYGINCRLADRGSMLQFRRRKDVGFRVAAE